ncbi:hypothetical protein Tco_1184634 [Tanacetum coccineum]
MTCLALAFNLLPKIFFHDDVDSLEHRISVGEALENEVIALMSHNLLECFILSQFSNISLSLVTPSINSILLFHESYKCFSSIGGLLSPPERSDLSARVVIVSEEEHEVHLKTILDLLKKEKLYSKFSKCEFWLKEVQFLGHVVNRDGIHVDPSKVESVKN